MTRRRSYRSASHPANGAAAPASANDANAAVETQYGEPVSR